jgi:LacI family transcriptional regulator
VGALRALPLDGRRPALVGFDDFELAELLPTPVTVVAYDPGELGRLAAELICRRLDGDDRPLQRVALHTTLIARGSGEVGP